MSGVRSDILSAGGTTRMRTLVFCTSMLAIGAGLFASVGAQPQSRPAMTAGDYARAERFMPGNVTPLVYRSGVRGTWLPDDRVWYRVTTENGSEATLVNAATGVKPACDLPEHRASGGRRGGSGGQAAARGGRGPTRTDVPSPDRKRTVFIKDWNLWIRDVASGRERQLTKDGAVDFGYATDNAGWA